MVVTRVGAVRGGGGAAVGDGHGVAALGTSGVLASVGPASLMKRTVGAGRMFLGASGFGRSEGFSACAGDSTSVVDLCYEAFGEEGVGVYQSGGSDVREGGSDASASVCGVSFLLAAKKCVQAWGREDRGFRLVSPSQATSVAEALFIGFFLWPRPVFVL